jgi:hypothetical protein
MALMLTYPICLARVKAQEPPVSQQHRIMPPCRRMRERMQSSAGEKRMFWISVVMSAKN